MMEKNEGIKLPSLMSQSSHVICLSTIISYLPLVVLYFNVSGNTLSLSFVIVAIHLRRVYGKHMESIEST